MGGVDCYAQPLERSEENGICEILGGCAPACTAARPCPRMVGIPRGISTESQQVMDLVGVARSSEGHLVGSGLHLVNMAAENLTREDRTRLWRRVVALLQWFNLHRVELRQVAERRHG